MTPARALLFTILLVTVAPAAAQYYPPPPPPPPGPPPPPPPGPPPPPPEVPPGPPPAPPPGRRYAPPYRQAIRPPGNAAPRNAARVAAGVAFVNDAYDCWYTGGAFGCGYGYGAAWPNLAAEVDVGFSHLVALDVGANVSWGDWNDVHNTVWEPHLDVLFRSQPYSDIRGRVRIGAGILAARASQTGVRGTRTETGAAFRIGAGVSFLARSRVGIGLDAVFEAGSIGGFYVSTVQLLLGPELHF